MSRNFKYSSWDNTQNNLIPDLDDLLDSLSDDLLQYGDVSRALRQLLQQGMNRPHGQQNMRGIYDMLQELRSKRHEMLAQNNLNSAYQDLKDRLDAIVRQERESIERRLDDLDQQPQDPSLDNAALQDFFKRMAQKNLATLHTLPENPGEAIQELKEYEFLDPEAGRAFQELLQTLQKSVMDSFFQNISQQLESMTPEDMEELQRMTSALNDLLEQRLRGQDPDISDFMKEFGHLFGQDPPQNLDELLDRLRGQMGQMQSLLNSLSPDQRESLLDLLGSQLFNQGLQSELARLAANLDQMMPQGVSSQEYSFFGDDDVSLNEAMKLIDQLQDIENLERQLERARFGSDAQGIDLDLVRDLLGDEAARELDDLRDIAKRLEEAGYLERHGSQLTLTPRAIRKIGEKALRDIFLRLRKDSYGSHQTSKVGLGQELSGDTRQYKFGDPFLLDLQRTIMNAIMRGEPGVPVRLSPPDFEVRSTELQTRTTTVLALDVSRSMPMRGNFVAAKKVALALSTLIRTQFPRDVLYLVGFSGFAREVDKDELPRLNVGDFGRGTNLQAGLRVARRLLAKHRGSQRQVILITDGEPTAYFEPDGRLSIEYPPGPRVLRETLNEVRRCTKEEIIINTFMLEKSYHLKAFVSQLARANSGKVLFTSPEHLGEYVMVDYFDRKGRGGQS